MSQSPDSSDYHLTEMCQQVKVCFSEEIMLMKVILRVFASCFTISQNKLDNG
jgi:hypothetical protein